MYFSQSSVRLFSLLLAILCVSCSQSATESPPPNILWINIDDQSPWYGTYGDEEELYDLQNDPDEVINLAGNSEYEAVMNTLREQLAAWIEDTDDKGQYPRSAAAMKEITDRFPESWLQSPEFKKNRKQDED
jgi:hypothetical protein